MRIAASYSDRAANTVDNQSRAAAEGRGCVKYCIAQLDFIPVAPRERRAWSWRICRICELRLHLMIGGLPKGRHHKGRSNAIVRAYLPACLKAAVPVGRNAPGLMIFSGRRCSI